MSVETLAKALDGLQHDSDRRQEYNVWLEEFQRSTKAWEVVHEVLSSAAHPRALKIFCAQTLRNKVAYDIHQVPRESRLHLKEQILVLLEVNQDLLNVVGVQLCIALAAFAMQVAEWEQPVEELMSRFDTMEMVPLLFEFLKVLPEEFNATRAGLVDPSLRLKRSTSLIQNNAPLVLNFMMSQANIMAQSGETQSLFFETLKPWLNEIDLPQIIASPLVDWIVAAIANDDARPAAVDCMIAVVQETNEVHEPVVQDAIKVLFPRIVALAPEYAPSYENDPELLRDCIRLFSEAGRAWHVLICKDPGNFMPMLEAVVQCIVTPVADLEAIEFSFDFFDAMRTVIGEPLPGAPQDPNEVPRGPFIELFLQLYDAFTGKLEFPESFNGNLEEEETFRDFRYDIGDMLKICSSIAGHEPTLHQAHDKLAQYASMEVTSQRLHSVEAIFFSLRAIARTIPIEENVWLPKIHQMLTYMPYIEEIIVKHAVLMFISRYSQWTAVHPQYLSFELQYILNSVLASDEEVRRAAAHAFLYLCTDAAHELVSSLPQLLQFYSNLTGTVDLEAQCRYSDGIGAIIGRLTGTSLAQAISMVFTPVAQRSATILSVRNSGRQLSPEEAQQIGHDIQALGSMLAMINPPDLPEDISDGGNSTERTSSSHTLAEAVRAHHELFTSVLMQFRDVPILVESVSRYYVRVVFNLGPVLADEVLSLVRAIKLCAETNGMQPVLYELGSAIVQCYNPRENSPPQLVNDVWQFSLGMSQHLFSEEVARMLVTEGGIVERATDISMVLYHGFHLLCDTTAYYPSEFFSHLLEPGVAFAVKIFEYVWDTDALTATGHFFEDIESYVPQYGKVPNAEIKAKITETVEKNGYDIVHSLFYLFLMKPDVYFEPMAERIVDFAFRLAPVSSVSWMERLLQTLPPGTISDEEKMVFAEQMFRLVTMGNRGIGREMNHFVKAYGARTISPR